jgi:cytoskeleton protein RodZ
MATVGEIFKKARREQKLTLKKVAEKIKVRKDYLLALEENRYQDLPSAVYIQGFIRNYSQILGLKAEPLLAKFRRDYK